MSSPVVQPRALARLLTDLAELDVDLPAEVANAATVLEAAASGELAQQAARQTATLDLLSADRGALLEHIQRRAVLAVVTDRLAESVWEVTTELAAATAAVLREHADEILDQLRPRFEAAAKAVHAAGLLGLVPRITPAEILTLTPAAVDAWHSLPTHVAVLEEIAAVRNAMTDQLGIAPDPDPFGPRQYGAAFGTGWTDESGVNRWLRLSAGMSKPLTLLTLEETRQAANATRAVPRPIVVPERQHDAPFAASGAWSR